MFGERARVQRDQHLFGEEASDVAENLAAGRAVCQLRLAELADDVPMAALEDRRRVRNFEADGTRHRLFQLSDDGP